MNYLLLNHYRRKIRNFVSPRPCFYIPIALAKNNKFMVSRSTDLLIEGFPRSANTFVEASIRISQKKEIRLAHHTHASSSVIFAAQNRIPTLVLVRHPLDAIASYMEMLDDSSVAALLVEEYCVFYSALRDYHDAFVVVPFSDMPTCLSRSIQSLNEKFETSFSPITADENFTMNAYLEVDRLNLERNRVAIDRYSPRKSESYRSERHGKLKKAREILRQRFAEPLGEAEVIFHEFVSHASS